MRTIIRRVKRLFIWIVIAIIALGFAVIVGVIAAIITNNLSQ